MSNILGKFFYDDKGKIVLAQFPNFPLIAWGIFRILGFIDIQQINNISNFLSSSFLFVWAYLEIAYGVNYFRRTLGLIVILFQIYSNF